MSSLGTIYQSIEILSKEKGIDPKIILDAVKDAMLVAARKHFHTNEDLVADFDEQTGAIQIFGVRRVVAEVTDPDKEISLEAARAIESGRSRLDGEIRFAKPTEALGRISAQTAKQVILQKVREAERENIYSEYSGRVGELVTCVVKRVEGPGPGRRPGQDRGAAAEEGAIEARKFQRGRPHPLRDQERGKGRQERGRDRVARRAGAGDAPVRTGSAGDLRQHGDHQRLRARSRRAHQDRGLEPRPRRG